MSQLEKKVKPILSPMILGERAVNLDLPALTRSQVAVLRTCLFHELNPCNDIPRSTTNICSDIEKRHRTPSFGSALIQEPAATAGYATKTGIPTVTAINTRLTPKLYGTR